MLLFCAKTGTSARPRPAAQRLAIRATRRWLRSLPWGLTKGFQMSFTKIALVAFTSVSAVLISAAVSAARTKPNTPGLHRKWATLTKESFGSVTSSPFSASARAIQPPPLVATAARGARTRIQHTAIRRASFTLFSERKRMMMPWFMSMKAPVLARPSWA